MFTLDLKFLTKLIAKIRQPHPPHPTKRVKQHSSLKSLNGTKYSILYKEGHYRLFSVIASMIIERWMLWFVKDYLISRNRHPRWGNDNYWRFNLRNDYRIIKQKTGSNFSCSDNQFGNWAKQSYLFLRLIGYYRMIISTSQWGFFINNFFALGCFLWINSILMIFAFKIIMSE